MKNNNLAGAYQSKLQGFTLVEMAIVLVVVGLLVGVILSAMDLIRTSRLRSVITDVRMYIEATQNFRTKYKTLPGDMTDATSYWGTDPSGCPTNSDTTSFRTTTCNGNGDGTIDDYTSTTTYERFRVFQHLSNAGLIPGVYTGVAGSAGSKASLIGTNVPASKIPLAGYSLFYMGIYSGSGSYYDANYGHTLYIGSVPSSTPNTSTKYAVITPAEAFNIDKKMDDGLPGYGSVMGYKATAFNAPGCTTTDVVSTAAYAISSSDILCSLIFKMGF